MKLTEVAEYQLTISALFSTLNINLAESFYKKTIFTLKKSYYLLVKNTRAGSTEFVFFKK